MRWRSVVYRSVTGRARSTWSQCFPSSLSLNMWAILFTCMWTQVVRFVFRSLVLLSAMRPRLDRHNYKTKRLAILGKVRRTLTYIPGSPYNQSYLQRSQCIKELMSEYFQVTLKFILGEVCVFYLLLPYMQDISYWPEFALLPTTVQYRQHNYASVV